LKLLYIEVYRVTLKIFYSILLKLGSWCIMQYLRSVASYVSFHHHIRRRTTGRVQEERCGESEEQNRLARDLLVILHASAPNTLLLRPCPTCYTCYTPLPRRTRSLIDQWIVNMFSLFLSLLLLSFFLSLSHTLSFFLSSFLSSAPRIDYLQERGRCTRTARLERTSQIHNLDSSVCCS